MEAPSRHLGGRSRLYRSMLLSYIIILLIPISLLPIAVNAFQRDIDAQMASANQASLSALRNAIDSQIDTLFNVSSRLMIDTRTQRLSKMDEVSVQQDFDDLSELRSQIVSSVLHSEFIDDILLYFPQSDLTLTKDGMFRGTDDFQYYLAKYLPMNSEEWATHLRFNGRKQTHMLTGIGAQVLLYHKYTNTQAEDSLPVVMTIIRMNTRAIQRILTTLNDQSALLLRVRDGNAVLRVDHSPISSMLSEPSHSSTLVYELATVEKSGIFHHNWSFIGYFALCVAVCLVLVVSFTRIHYSPIRRMTDLLLRTQSTLNLPEGNEYRFLEREISDMLVRLQNSQDMVGEYERMHREHMLRGLLRGDVASMANASETLGFISNQFILLLYSIDEVDLTLTDQEEETASITMIDRIVATTAGYPKQESNRKYAFESDDGIVCLVNFSGEAEEEIRRITAESRENAEYLLHRFSISVSVVVGKPIHELTALPNAFKLVRSALDILKLTDRREIMVIEQEAEMDHTETGALSTWLVQAQTLDHCMLSRDFVGAHTILDQLLQDTLMDDALQSAGQMRIVRLHMSTLIDTIRMALMSMGKLSETGEAFRRSIMNDLTNADSIPKIRDCIQNMCTGFAELFAMEAGTDQMEARNREIIDYIESHFRDPDLNLNALSQQFALSASYISTLIKKVAGLSPIDLIHSLRISEAKRLLTSHPKMLVKDIAETVGYGSSLNLIRAFRRSEGVTPTMYRNLMNSKEQDGQNT